MEDYEATVQLMLACQKGQSVTSFLHELYNLAKKTRIIFNETDFIKIVITKLNNSKFILLAGSNSWAELLDKAHESVKLIFEQGQRLMQSLFTKQKLQFMNKRNPKNQNHKISKKSIGKKKCYNCGKCRHVFAGCEYRIKDEIEKLDKELDVYMEKCLVHEKELKLKATDERIKEEQDDISDSDDPNLL